ncbi:MAG: hypothetical protein K0U40_05600 [Betaproteobacteria bacterium]|nr:hypothetical protein [Betaproteobacteria bacterium]
MADIKLNLINLSEDASNSDYVIFQRNINLDSGIQAVAWKVIQSLGNGANHPFTYPQELYVGAKDANGNYMQKILAKKGYAYEMINTLSGHELRSSPMPAASPVDVEVSNKLAKGSIDAQIYRGGSLLAAKVNIAPGSKANFQFQSILFIGSVSQVVEGTAMNSNVTVQYLTELNLMGISVADIIISGGGVGTESTAIKFTLAPTVSVL